MADINLSPILELLGNPNISTNLTVNSIKDENPKDGRLRRFKETVLFVTLIIIVLSIFIICTVVVLETTFDSSVNRWAMTIDSDIISAFLALLVGRKIG